MVVCATLTVTANIPVRDCTSSHYCDANCPGALTAECQSPNPCVANHCASTCPDANTCGLCGNLDTPANRLIPSHPCYVLSSVDVCQASPCTPGCSDATKCGVCGNAACPSVIACETDPCLAGCPYKCGCTASDPCPVDCAATPCADTCPTATNCTICPSYYGCTLTSSAGSVTSSYDVTSSVNPSYQYPEVTTTSSTDIMSTMMANPSMLALLAVGVVGIVVMTGRK